jgi:hypothetical protein
MRGKEATMIELTEEQRVELEKQQPALVQGPKAKEVYVLLRKDVYERVQSIVRQINDRSDWDDAAFDVYDQETSTARPIPPLYLS